MDGDATHHNGRIDVLVRESATGLRSVKIPSQIYELAPGITQTVFRKDDNL
jgi:hypothetical protein